jgi:AcrR family transcriptional regulator
MSKLDRSDAEENRSKPRSTVADRVAPTRGASPARVRRSQVERAEETKRRILEAAARLIVRKGYAELRVADVAAEAGVSVGAQLHHFPQKDALVVAVIEHCFGEAGRNSRNRATDGATADQVLKMAIEDAKSFFFSDHFLIAINIVLSTQPPSDMREAVLNISRDARLPVERSWRDAMIAAGFPEEIAGDVITMSFGLIRGFAIRRLWDSDDVGQQRCIALWEEMVGLLIERHRPRKKGARP